jgi:hypothetical protein
MGTFHIHIIIQHDIAAFCSRSAVFQSNATIVQANSSLQAGVWREKIGVCRPVRQKREAPQ